MDCTESLKKQNETKKTNITLLSFYLPEQNKMI